MPKLQQGAISGIGKDATRTDLQGTPGLHNSSLQQGDVQQLERGQQVVQDTQQAQAAAAPVAPAADPALAAPDPLQFALQKAGGNGAPIPEAGLTNVDVSEYLPLMREVASGKASPLLQQAYLNMYRNLQNQPYTGAGTGLVDRQLLDRAVTEAF